MEVRNNLVAASQNIQGAQNYLSSVKFPYCAPPEVDTLNKVDMILSPTRKGCQKSIIMNIFLINVKYACIHGIKFKAFQTIIKS